MARLRSQCSLRPKLSFMSRKPSLIAFLWGTLSYVLIFCSSTFSDSTAKDCVVMFKTVMFTIVKNLHISGPVQFTQVLFKDQL